MAGLDDLLGDGKLESPALGDAIGGGTNKEIMASARMVLSGNWGLVVLGYVLYTALWMSFWMFMISALFFVRLTSGADGGNSVVAVAVMQLVVQVSSLLLSGAFVVGFMGFFLGIAQEAEARLELLFIGFRRFFRSFAVYFLYSLIVSVASMLLVVPGIIAAIGFSMAFFCIADGEGCGPFEALGRSWRMMGGNKWKFFCLQWRFFGWALLCTLLPIGWLWLVPYIQTSYAKFYEDVK